MTAFNAPIEPRKRGSPPRTGFLCSRILLGAFADPRAYPGHGRTNPKKASTGSLDRKESANCVAPASSTDQTPSQRQPPETLSASQPTPKHTGKDPMMFAAP